MDYELLSMATRVVRENAPVRRNPVAGAEADLLCTCALSDPCHFWWGQPLDSISSFVYNRLEPAQSDLAILLLSLENLTISFANVFYLRGT